MHDGAIFSGHFSHIYPTAVIVFGYPLEVTVHRVNLAPFVFSSPVGLSDNADQASEEQIQIDEEVENLDDDEDEEDNSGDDADEDEKEQT